MKTQKNSPETLEEIIFRNRNKAYGAYFLRKTYGRTLAISVIIAVFGLSCIVTFSKLALKPAVGPEVTIVDSISVTIPGDMPPVVPELPAARASGPSVNPLLAPRVVDTIGEVSLPAEPTGPSGTDTSGNLGTDGYPVPEPSETPPVIEVEKPDSIHVAVQEMPAFPGGEEALARYLAKAVIYPEEARELNITGTVYIMFVVEKDGSISQVSVKRGIGGGCEEAALRAVKMMPRWNPGRQQGIPVRVQFYLPVRFTLR